MKPNRRERGAALVLALQLVHLDHQPVEMGRVLQADFEPREVHRLRQEVERPAAHAVGHHGRVLLRRHDDRRQELEPLLHVGDEIADLAAYLRGLSSATSPGVDSSKGKPVSFARWHSSVRGLPESFGELPVAALAEEIDSAGDDRIRGLITVAGNPVLSTPNGGRLAQALESLEKYKDALKDFRT